MARFYDLIYDQARSPVDVEYYLKKIKEAKGKVLEVGVGTGRILLPALEAGADIYGMDISPPMINRLLGGLKPDQHQRIWTQNLPELKSDKKYSLIIAPFRVFSHLIGKEEPLEALNRIYDHLEDNGLLIFDLYVPNVKMLANGLDNFEDFHGEYMPGKNISRVVSMKADVVNQLSSVSMNFIWDNEEGGKSTYAWESEMRFYFRYEIEHLVKRSNLELIEIFGDFKESQLNSLSKEFIIHARRN